MIEKIMYTYTRPGKNVATFEHWLVLDEPEVKAMLMENYTGRDLIIDDTVVACNGSPLLWYVFPDRWHDIGRFHLPDGTFTGWYTNLCTPFSMDGNNWASTDLFLDLWQFPNGQQQWLDEDELADAIEENLLDEAQQIAVAEERSYVQRHLDEGNWPPPIAHELDLSAAKRLLTDNPERTMDSNI